MSARDSLTMLAIVPLDLPHYPCGQTAVLTTTAIKLSIGRHCSLPNSNTLRLAFRISIRLIRIRIILDTVAICGQIIDSAIR
jgi:hypothetical protein